MVLQKKSLGDTSTLADKFGNELNIGGPVWVKCGKVERITEEGLVLVSFHTPEGQKFLGWFPASDIIADTCFVKPHCLSAERRGECRKCKDMSKFERKKSKSRQATGRSNKRKGKDSEKKLLLHFQRQDLDARIIEGSGAYKKSRGAGFDSDLRVVIKGKERKVENKKYGSRVAMLNRIRKLIGEKGILYITDFCYIMDENVFYDLLRGVAAWSSDDNGNINKVDTEEYSYRVREVADRDWKLIHDFYKQDYADIVSLDESYRDFLFVLQPSLFKEICQ